MITSSFGSSPNADIAARVKLCTPQPRDKTLNCAISVHRIKGQHDQEKGKGGQKETELAVMPEAHHSRFKALLRLLGRLLDVKGSLSALPLLARLPCRVFRVCE